MANKNQGSLIFKFVGLLFFLGGGWYGIQYYLMDTSVPIPSVSVTVDGKNEYTIHRVHNLGLMDERRTGLMLCVGAFVGGFVLMYIGDGEKKD